MKIRIGILDEEKIYISRLIRYFAVHYSDKVEVSAFYDEKKFLVYIQQTKIDV